METAIWRRLALAVVAGGLAGSAWSSQEGPLPLSIFRLESKGIGGSGRITIEGRQNEQGQLVGLRIRAFGRRYVLAREKLAPLAALRPNGVRLSYEHGYQEVGGRTLYLQFQVGGASTAVETALITVQEDGQIEVGQIRNPESAEPPFTPRAS